SAPRRALPSAVRPDPHAPQARPLPAGRLLVAGFAAACVLTLVLCAGGAALLWRNRGMLPPELGLGPGPPPPADAQISQPGPRPPAPPREWSSAALVRTFSGHHHIWVEDVAALPDGRGAVSCGYDHTVRLWDLQTGREVRRFDHTGPVRSVTV